MTTLWDKFKSSIRWIVSTTDAAVTVVQGADSTQDAERLLDGQGSTTAEPSSDSDGVSIEGQRTTNLFYRHGTSGNTSKVKLWLFIPDPQASTIADQWHLWGEVTLGKDEDILDPFDLEGGWRRIYAQVSQAPTDTVTMWIAPHSK